MYRTQRRLVEDSTPRRGAGLVVRFSKKEAASQARVPVDRGL